MSFSRSLCFSLASVILFCCMGNAQTASSPSSAVVPQLVNYFGKATDAKGNAITGIAGITFSIYKDQYEGAPLWMETQNVTSDSKGNYSVQLGATTSQGLPLGLFTSGEARWLGVRINGGEEQPRVMLLSVPYALKAGDAATVGGLPPSAFVLAVPASSAASNASSDVASETAQPALGGSGTADYVPLWTPDGNTLGNSVLFQSGTGSTAKIGINTTTPASTLDVKGGETVRGPLALPATGTATSTAGKNSQPEKLTASSYNSSTKAAVNEGFEWQTEPTGNNTSSPSGTLNLLFGSGSSTPAETGLNIASSGQIHFAAGQTFPGTGSGTITGVTAGTDLTGGGSSGTVTLNVDTTKVPQLNAANTFTGNQTVNGNLTATGVVTGSSYQIGGFLFAWGSSSFETTFLGVSAGLANVDGNYDTGLGFAALLSNTTGISDTATGAQALSSNSTGNNNTATGTFALYSNTTGGYNTASGSDALFKNKTGGNNTATGYIALENSDGAFDNTATGYAALFSSTTAGTNTADGAQALYNATTGGGNTASGYQALYSDTTGYLNTAVGYQALYSNITGTYLNCIGYNCSATDGLTNATAIGAFAKVAQSNALVLGGMGDHAVKVGIGTSEPSNVLTIARGAGHPVSDSWETYSSRRWKTNIKTLPDALAKVEHLRGVSYELKDSGKHEIGVIAEEVGAVVPEVVSYEANGKDASGVDYSRLTALLIEAVKQQQKQIAAQAQQIRRLRSKDALLDSQLRELQTTVHQLRRANGAASEADPHAAKLMAKAQF